MRHYTNGLIIQLNEFDDEQEAFGYILSCPVGTETYIRKVITPIEIPDDSWLSD